MALGLGLEGGFFFCGLWDFGLVSLGCVNTNVFEWVWILGLEKTEVFNKVFDPNPTCSLEG